MVVTSSLNPVGLETKGWNGSSNEPWCVKLSMSQDDLLVYATRLIDAHAPDGRKIELGRVMPIALERLEHCFLRIALAGFCDERGEATFDHLHGDQVAMFLYFAANTAWKEFNDVDLAKKLTLLNRDRHGLLVMYDTELPKIFVIPHTVGTVIGKGSYGNYAVFCQNVTTTNDYARLTVGNGVIFFPGAFVIGNCTIGDGAVVTANTTVTYDDIPPNTMARGCSPKLELWRRERDFLARFFIPPYPGRESAR